LPQINVGCGYNGKNLYIVSCGDNEMENITFHSLYFDVIMPIY